MYYGLDVGGTKIEFAAFDKDLKQVVSERISTPKSSYSLLIKSIVDLINKYDKQFEVKGQVGIGIPGIESATDKRVVTPNIECANQQTLRLDIQTALGRPIAIENDANCFALSEAFGGESQPQPIILGLILGTGFGAGIINNGRVVSGKNNMTGEFGHMRLPIDAWFYLKDNLTESILECGCGKSGCLDNYLSGRGFESLYYEHYGVQLSAIEIIDNYYKNIRDAVFFVEHYIEFLAMCLGSIFTALDPNTVYLGGGMSKFDALYEKMPGIIKKHMMPNTDVPEIKKAMFGDSGGVRGAALLNY